MLPALASLISILKLMFMCRFYGRFYAIQKITAEALKAATALRMEKLILNMYQPIRPAPCMLAMGAAPFLATL